MTETTHDDIIARDVDCLTCGYNLRGLRGGGVCPECGGPVAESLKDRGLSAANPSWRRTLRRGVAAATLEYLTMMTVVLLAQVVDVEQHTTVLLGLMAASATLGGWWVARREPGKRGGGRLRVTLRGATVGLGGAYVLILMLEAGWWPEWYANATMAFFAANVCKTALQMTILARLAKRTPGTILRRTAIWMIAIGPAVWGLMLLEQFIGNPSWLEWAIIAGVALSSLAVVAYFAWWYRALRRPRPAA